jgi:hypothetical protein
MTTAQVAGLTTDQVAILTTAQIVALTSTQATALTTASVVALTTAQLVAVETTDLAAMKTAQIAALTTTQVGALTNAQIIGLTTAQIVSLSTDQLVSLSTAQLVAIETTDLAAMKTAQIVALTTTQLPALTTTQVQALTMTQVSAFTSTAAFTTTQIPYLTMGSPIVLDLNGDGVKTLGFQSGVNFDLFATGKAVSTGWVSGSDGLLVMDRNQNGTIDSGAELFGTSTTLANGSKAADGYAALRELDSNGDGVVDAKDKGFADLRVWVDSNSDGLTEAGELKTLASLNITSISTQAQTGTEMQNGNLLGLTSTYQTTDGANHAAADVWFVADKAAALAPVASATESAIPALDYPLTDPKAWAAVASVNASPTGTGLAAPAANPALTDVPQDNLRARVSSLAQAIGSFGSAAAADVPPPVQAPDATANAAGVAFAASPVVGSMVDVMKQFDSNGNPIADPKLAVASAIKPIGLSGVPKAGSDGILTSGG